MGYGSSLFMFRKIKMLTVYFTMSVSPPKIKQKQCVIQVFCNYVVVSMISLIFLQPGGGSKDALFFPDFTKKA